MAASPTVSIYGQRGLTGNGDVATADIADDAVTAAKIADDAVTGDIIADNGIDAGKLGLGAVSNYLMVAGGALRQYHMGGATIISSTTRDLAATDVEGRLIACGASITLSVVGTIATTGSDAWRTGQSVVIYAAGAHTVTIAAGSGQTLLAPYGATISGNGAAGFLYRVGTNSWLFLYLGNA